jgi:hypothetical protein
MTSSRTYKVHLPELVIDRVTEWGFSIPFQLRLYRRIRRLLSTGDAEQVGRRIVAPIRCFVCHFSMRNDEIDKSLRFSMWVNDTSYPGIRIVLEIQYRDEAEELQRV